MNKSATSESFSTFSSAVPARATVDGAPTTVTRGSL